MSTDLTYESWLREVRATLASINMLLEDWQKQWAFDFEGQYSAGASPNEAAERANRFWWYKQNKVLKRECLQTPNCWLPREHSGDCQPV
jgi:hypothetical protein